MSELKVIEPEYVYVTIPAEYICVYHRILVMLADYGEDMLKDCKATCKDRSSNVIDCYNMFNAAVAARKIGKTKLAETLIKYIKAKINQIYKDKDNSTSFVFPVDEDGHIKAFVSCGEVPLFRIDERDMKLYKHKYINGFDEHFKLGKNDGYEKGETDHAHSKDGLNVVIKPLFEESSEGVNACCDVDVTYAGEVINLRDTVYQYYFDRRPVKDFRHVVGIEPGVHTFTIVVTYKDETQIASDYLLYGLH